MKIKVLFGRSLIVVELLEHNSFSGRTVIIKWGALFDTSFENDELMVWAKPYENEKMDKTTKKSILYYLCCELRELDYTEYRAEYIGNKAKSAVDEIINNGISEDNL
jgi:hypothetical protein